jgi:hypothetical protein
MAYLSHRVCGRLQARCGPFRFHAPSLVISLAQFSPAECLLMLSLFPPDSRDNSYDTDFNHIQSTQIHNMNTAIHLPGGWDSPYVQRLPLSVTIIQKTLHKIIIRFYLL